MSVLINGMEMPKKCLDCPFMVSRDNDDCILQSDEANAEDLRASRSVSETLAMAIGRIADAFCGYGEAAEEAAPEEAEGSST